MASFLTVSLFSFIVVAIGDFIILYILTYAGTGFGFGDLKKDILKLLCVSVIIGLVDGAWSLAPVQHIAFHGITVFVHAFVLAVFFFEEMARQEAFIVAVCQRILYLVIAVTILAATASGG